MADGYARVSGKVAACSVHQGPGLTNTITGLTEAAKSRTPVVLVAADTPAAALAVELPHRPGGARRGGRRGRRARPRAGDRGGRRSSRGAARAGRAPRGRADGAARRPGRRVPSDAAGAVRAGARAAPRPAQAAVEAVAASAGRRRAAGDRGRARRGARGRRAGAAGARRADRRRARHVRRGQRAVPRAIRSTLGIAGGFSSPLAARLLREADLVVAFGAALNQWTTRHGSLIAPGTRVVQVDLDAERDRRAPAGRRSGSSAMRPRPRRRCSTRCRHVPAAAVPRSPPRSRRRRWRDEPYAETSHAGAWIRARSASRSTICCPTSERSSSTPAHFMGWPSMYLRVPDAAGFVFPQAFQCVGLGLGQRHRRRDRAAGPADRRRARRRRRADGAAGARDARPARAAVAGRDLRRRGLRRRGPPLPAAGRGGRPRAVPRRPTSPRSPRRPAAAA